MSAVLKSEVFRYFIKKYHPNREKTVIFFLQYYLIVHMCLLNSKHF